MKKFSLKPQGGSCMKMFCKSWLFIGLLVTFCLAACSDDDDKAETPVFPAKQNIVCNAGETTDFTFTANTNWSLASSAIWCKFKSDATEEYVVSGTAGTHTVTVMATGDDQKVDKASVAKLELTMGGQTIVIGEVTRSAVGSELKIFDLEGNEIDKSTGLKVGYDSYAQFKVKANFRFAVTNLPGWVQLEGGSLVGTVDKEVKGGLKIIQDENREKYPVEANIEKNVITFADEEGKAFYEFPIYYEGMNSTEIKLTTPTTFATGWVVTMDGKTFTQQSIGGTGTTTLQNRLPFTIKTLKDDYVIVFMSKGWDDKIHLVGSMYDFFTYDWMHCEGEKGNLSIMIDEYKPNSWNGDPEERSGYILAFSREVYERDIKDKEEEAILTEEGEIEYRYEQSNLIMAFTQKEVKEETGPKSFTIKKGGEEDVSVTQTTDQNLLEIIQGNYSIENKNVYSMSANAGDYFLIYPLLSANEWAGAVSVINRQGQNITVDGETEGEGDDMYYGITIPDTFVEELIIIFRGPDYINRKALVITPAN